LAEVFKRPELIGSNLRKNINDLIFSSQVSRDEKECFVGTGPFCAAETFEEDALVTSKADIFSLGCVVFEMLALQAPHVHLLGAGQGEEVPDEEDDDLDDKENDDAYEAYSDALGTRPDLPSTVKTLKGYESVLAVFYACTELRPEQRPSAQDILNSLKNA